MRRIVITALLTILALAIVITLLVLSPYANAGGMMRVGSLMGSSSSASAVPATGIATEANTVLTTEAGNSLITE